MELEEAVKNLNDYIFAIDNFGTIDPKCCNNLYEPAKVILKELDKKDKAIEYIKDKKNTSYYEIMTEEEKEAIFKIREIIEFDKKHRIETIYDKKTIDFRNNIELMLNLLEKLKKENEDLNNRDTSRLSEIGELRTRNSYLEDELKYYYVSKDKIGEIKNKNIGQYMNFYREIEELL